MDELVERLVHSAWAELERQAQYGGHDSPYVDAEMMIIDGHVDMASLVAAILEAARNE